MKKHIFFALLCSLVVSTMSCKKEEIVRRVQLDQASLVLFEGDSKVLKPVGIEGENIIWTSSYPQVAEVDANGKVQAIEAGQTTIVMAVGGMSALCDVTVKMHLEGPIIYVAGYETINGKKVATLWKNRVAQKLTDGTQNAEASSVYAVGRNVYVAGYQGVVMGIPIATLWQNGDVKLLSGNYSHGRSVFVSDNQYYVAGEEIVNSGHSNPTLWKKTEPTSTSLIKNIHGASYGHSTYVANGNVYVAGTHGQEAKLWKNGVEMNLSLPANASTSSANVVWVSGNDVYVAGELTLKQSEAPLQAIWKMAVLWKNGNMTKLTNGTAEATTHSIFVNGEDVYVSGYMKNAKYTEVAAYWKNNELVELSDGTHPAQAYSIFIADDEVYVAGSERINNKYTAVIWQRGDRIILSQPENEKSAAHSMYIIY